MMDDSQIVYTYSKKRIDKDGINLEYEFRFSDKQNIRRKTGNLQISAK